MNKQIVFQDGILNSLRKVLNNINPKSIFLVTGKKSFSDSGAKRAVDTLIKNFHYFHFFDFEENPKIEDVERGLYEFHRNSCDLIIAIGGGSVMDMGKLICGLSHQKDDIKKLVQTNSSNSNAAQIIAIPTTAGTGSEATKFAVVYIKNEKYSFTHDNILPKYVILDSSLTYSAPPYLVAVTGVDALCQSIESLWSLNSTKESIEFAEKALELIWNNLENAVLRSEINSKDKMLIGAYLAGKAINISKTTACHAISYKLTSKYNIPHGQAVGITLTEIMRLNFQYSQRSILRILEIIEATNLDDGILKINKLLTAIGIKLKLRELEIPFEGIKGLTKFNLERMKNNPAPLQVKDIESILNKIY